MIKGGIAVVAALAALASCKADLARSSFDADATDSSIGKPASGGTSGRGGAAGMGGKIGMTGGGSGRLDASTTGTAGAPAGSAGTTGSASGGPGGGTGGVRADAGAAATGASGAGGMNAGSACGEGSALCSNACVDVTNSPEHCGTCTNKCSGGCSAGRCYKTLVPHVNNTSLDSFAVNAQNLYYLDRHSGDVSRILRGGGAATVVATDQNYGGRLALDSDTLFWLDEGNVSAPGGIVKMPLSGGPYSEFVTGEPNPVAIALDATNVYWSDYGPHFVKKVPKKGGTVVVLVSEDNADAAHTLVTDDRNLYWTSLVDGGTIFKLPLAGGSAVPLASNLYAIDYNSMKVTATGGNLYFLSTPLQAQHLLQLSTNGGAPMAIADVSGAPVIADDSAIYVADLAQSGSISRIDLKSHAVTKLAAEPRGVTFMVVQDNDLFWMNGDDEIKSTAKSP